jgi:hypothetical protein
LAQGRSRLNVPRMTAFSRAEFHFTRRLREYDDDH